MSQRFEIIYCFDKRMLIMTFFITPYLGWNMQRAQSYSTLARAQESFEGSYNSQEWPIPLPITVWFIEVIRV